MKSFVNGKTKEKAKQLEVAPVARIPASSPQKAQPGDPAQVAQHEESLFVSISGPASRKVKRVIPSSRIPGHLAHKRATHPCQVLSFSSLCLHTGWDVLSTHGTRVAVASFQRPQALPELGMAWVMVGG